MGPALQGIFVGQGPRALPGVRGKTGRRGEGTLPYGDVAGKCLRGIPQSASLTAPKGTGVTDCHDQCAHWSRNDRLQGMPWAGRCRYRPLRVRCKKCLRRDDVGSEPSAAGGRYSEVSEWPRSKFRASAVRQRGNFGHRNRTIVPYGGRITLFIHVQDK